MLYVGLPIGSVWGWGILGKEVTFELSRLTEICLLFSPDSQLHITDPFDYYQVCRLMPSPQVQNRLVGSRWILDGPVIQAMGMESLSGCVPEICPPSDVGFAVFEDNVLAPASVQQARRSFHHFATGSSYCADVLRQHGINDVSTVYHGVDTALFHPRDESRPFLRDKFLIFSGGKFELRKGQDIVIRAYKVIQDRHPDVLLVNSWFSASQNSRDTMAQSRLIRYFPADSGEDYIGWMNRLLSANGLDMDRVITVGGRDNQAMPSLYHATDVGLFPNRVEGGTNMVLMEYMACGKPVIASFNSGHKDVARRENAVLVEQHTPMYVATSPGVTCTWSDPSLDETVEKLEWCYQNRDRLGGFGRQAAADMRQFPWKRVAEGLLQAVRQVRGPVV